jgi:hypothetical protein
VNALLSELFVTTAITVESHDRTAVVDNAKRSGDAYQFLLVGSLLGVWRKLRATYRAGGFTEVARKTVDYLLGNAYGYWWALRYRDRAGKAATADLPSVLEIDATDLQYQSRFAKAHFPTKDGDTVRSAIHDEPIVGVVGGRWDRFRTEWTKLRIHRSLEARFVDDVPWEETPKYRYAAAKIEHGLEDWRSSTPAELEQRCADLETLHESMHAEGYVPQVDLLEDDEEDRMATGGAAMKPICGTEFPHEMRVGVGRNGELIRFSAGKHRLSIAKLLDLEAVPVVVVVRHERWAAIRTVFGEADSLRDVPEKYRDFADHPDLRAVSQWETPTRTEMKG